MGIDSNALAVNRRVMKRTIAWPFARRSPGNGSVASGASIGALDIAEHTSAPLRQVKTVGLTATSKEVLDAVTSLRLSWWAPSIADSKKVFSDGRQVCAHRVFANVESIREHLIVFKVEDDGQGGAVLRAYQYFNAHTNLRRVITEMLLTKVLKRMVREFGGRFI